MSSHRVEVSGLPAWIDLRRLLGPGAWAFEADDARLSAAADLEADAAGDLAARLRGVGLDGMALGVQITPPLKREAVREGRSDDAKRRRETSTGFTRAGTRTDAEGKVSLTPQALAEKIARSAGQQVVVDAGCGAGGNAIAFAGAGKRVVAIERDTQRLADARHNARVYGVEREIEWVMGDALTWLDDPQHTDALAGALVFVDPPWGVDWDRTRCDVTDFELLGKLLERRERFGALWAKLPPSFAAHEYPEAAPQAMFGEARGDKQRVKLVVMRW